MARKPPLAVTTEQGAEVGATRASAAYDQLRSDITQGILEPGSKLRVQAMCDRYQIGATPLREAMSRLSAEGLIERTDQRGFRVSELDWDELPVLTKTRIQLESLALAESIAHRNTEWEHQLAVHIHQLGRTPRSLSAERYVPNPQWETLHRAFHRTLIQRSPSRWLRAFCDTLSDEAYRFRQLAAGMVFSSRHEHEEHQQIFEAAIDGRTDEAVRLLAAHYQHTADIVAQHRALTKP